VPSHVGKPEESDRARTFDRLSSTRAFELLIVVPYVVLAAILGEIYPLSPLEMFATVSAGAGNLGVVDAHGALIPTSAYVDWNCTNGLAAPLDRLPDACLPDRGQGIVAKQVEYLRKHASADAVGEPVTLTRRVWSANATGPLSFHDCIVDTCTARRVAR
jgi:hypothetical protein